MKGKFRYSMVLPLIGTLIISLGLNGYFYFIGQKSYTLWGWTSKSERLIIVRDTLLMGVICGLPAIIAFVFPLSYIAFPPLKKSFKVTFIMWLLFMIGTCLVAFASYNYRP